MNEPRQEKKQRGGMASIDEVVSTWLRRNKVRQRLDKDAVFARWKSIVGEDIAARTRPVDIRSGELLVEVDSAPLLNELSTYYRQDILESLRREKEFQAIQNVRFRAGSF